MNDTPTLPYRTALIVGAGPGLSAAVARALRRNGVEVALACRHPGNLEDFARDIGARLLTCDAAEPAQVRDLFAALDDDGGTPEVVLYNPSFRVRGPFADLDPADVETALRVTAFGAFVTAQEAVRRMLPCGRGALLFTGASASVKGYAQSAPFAMGKFALRGMAQSLARELHPQGIHVVHLVVDGGIRSARRPEPPDKPDSMLDPDALAETYLHCLRQPRNAWTWEVEVRPWVERF